MSDTGTYTVKLTLAVLCTTCGEPRAVQTSGRCSVCDSPLPSEHVVTVREAVRRRRQAFKRRLKRLEERMYAVTDGPLNFATRGVPRSDDDHLHIVLMPAIDCLRVRHETVARLLETGTWDPDEDGCVAAFKELVTTLDAAINFVAGLCQMMPPIGWRAVHRELTHAAAQQIRGQVYMALTISATDYDVALRLQEQGNRSFAVGARHAERVSALITMIRQSPADGPFQTDGSLDVAALAWSSVGEQSTSIATGAATVRNAFAEIPGVSALPDEHVLGLLPLLASSARVVDHDILVQRAVQLRSTLDAGDAASGWVVNPLLLITRVQRGLERVVTQAERLGREWRHGLPRQHVTGSLTEVYRQLVEGALRDLGGVVLVAARASRGDDDASYEQDVVDGIKAGEIVSELERLGAPCGGAVDMLYRNASAHADIEVTDTGIVATARVIRGGRVDSVTTASLSDAEFAEEMVALQEILLALQLTILPWLWSHVDDQIAAAVSSMVPSDLERDHTIGLLGGLAGLHDVAVSVEGDHVVITAACHEDASDRRATKILTLVPAAFGAVPSANQVTLQLTDLQPVTFTRREFVGADSDGTPYGLTLLGLTFARWLLVSGMSWTSRDEATYVTFPLTQLHFDCMRLAGSEPRVTENIDRALESLCVVRARLDDVFAPDRRSLLTQRVVEQVDVLAAALAGLAESRRGQRGAAEGQSLAQQAVATLNVVALIQREAVALRDPLPADNALA
jgi:hypothetical protein